MTADESPLTSKAEFEAELQTLLRRAHAGGVNVEGGWDCRNGPGTPDWEAVVSEVTKPDQQD